MMTIGRLDRAITALKDTLGRVVSAFIVLLVLLLLAAACAAQAPPGSMTLVPKQAETVVNPLVIQHLDMLHTRMQGHATLPTQEYGMCVRGLLTPDTTAITQVSAARIDSAGPEWVAAWCEDETDFIGVTHNHPDTEASVGCATSVGDFFLFFQARTEVVIHTCDDAEYPNATVFFIRRRGNYAPAVFIYFREDRRIARMGPRP